MTDIASTTGKAACGISGAAFAGFMEFVGLSTSSTESLRIWLPWAFGLLVAFLTAVSITIDIVNKWRNRKRQ